MKCNIRTHFIKCLGQFFVSMLLFVIKVFTTVHFIYYAEPERKLVVDLGCLTEGKSPSVYKILIIKERPNTR